MADFWAQTTDGSGSQLWGQVSSSVPSVVSYMKSATQTKAAFSLQLAEDATNVQVNVYSEAAHTNLVASSAQQDLTEAGSLRIGRFLVTGLTPGTTYYARVSVSGQEVPTTSIEISTLDVAGTPKNLRIIFSNCNFTGSTDPVWDRMAARNGDLFIHTGDIHYEDGTTTDPLFYLNGYDQNFSSPQMRGFLENIPMTYTTDDHGYPTNNGDSNTPGLAAARVAIEKGIPHIDVVEDPTADVDPYYWSRVIGRFRIISPDLRTEREETPGSIMSPEQMTWIKNEITAAKNEGQAVILISSVPWITEQNADPNDDWSEYPSERLEIADHVIAEGMQDQGLILAGDMHGMAADDGTNNTYGTSGSMAWPVMHGGALHQNPSLKGGPYSQGSWWTRDGNHAVLDITDNGSTSVTLEMSGYDDTNTEQISLTSTLTLPQATAVATGAGTSVTETEATLNGTLASLEGNASMDVYFQWREQGAATWNQTATQTLTAPGSFTATLTGLTANTAHEYRAVAVGGGTTYNGAIEPFTTNPTPTGSGVVVVSTDFAGLAQGAPWPPEWDESLEPKNSIIEVGPNETGRIFAETDWQGARVTTTNTAIGADQRVTIRNLVLRLERYRRLTIGLRTTANNINGHTPSYGLAWDNPHKVYQFQLRGDQWTEWYPFIEYGNELGVTELASDITTNFPTDVPLDIVAEIVNNQLNFFVWPSADPKPATPALSVQDTTHNAAGAVVIQLSDRGGTAVGSEGLFDQIIIEEQVGFTSPTVGVTTNPVTAIQETSATLHGTLDSLGGEASASVYFEWRQQGASTWNQTPQQSLTATGTFTQTISGLTGSTNYEARAVAVAGGNTEVGTTLAFTTQAQPSPITVTTDPETNVTQTGATLNGTLNSLGGLGSVDVFFEWRQQGAGTWNSTATQPQTSTGSFSATLTGLTEGTTYEYRAKVVGNGTTYDGTTELLTTNAATPPPTDPGSLAFTGENRVENASGVPVEGATVYAVRLGVDLAPVSATTDANGEATITGLPSGVEYRTWAEKQFAGQTEIDTTQVIIRTST